MPINDAAWGQFQTIMREKLKDGVVNLMLESDDVGWRIVQQAEPIMDAGRKRGGTETGLWAEWEILMQESGYVSAGNMDGNTIQKIGTLNKLAIAQAADNGGYLDPLKSPMRSYLGIAIECKKIVGTMAVNQTQMETQLATKPLEQIAGGHIQDQVKHVRHYFQTGFWSDGSAHIAQVNNASGYNIVEANPVAVTIDTGSPFSFKRGQRYVAGSYVAPTSYGASARTARTGTTSSGAPGVFRCTNVNKKTRKVSFQSEPGQGTIALSDNDVIMLAGTYDFTQSTVDAGSKHIQGIHGLCKSSGQFPGADTGVLVEQYSELQAFVDGDYSSMEMPTPELIAEYLDWIDTAGSELPPMLVSERSVQTLYSQYERAQNFMYLVPQGRPAEASGGVTAPMFTHGDKAFVWPTSNLCRPNTIYGTSPTDLVRFMPIGDGSIRWEIGTGVLSGYSGIFRPVLTSGGERLSGVAEAPYKAFGQLGMTRPNKFFIIQGVKSQRDV